MRSALSAVYEFGLCQNVNANLVNALGNEIFQIGILCQKVNAHLVKALGFLAYKWELLRFGISKLTLYCMY